MAKAVEQVSVVPQLHMEISEHLIALGLDQGMLDMLVEQTTKNINDSIKPVVNALGKEVEGFTAHLERVDRGQSKASKLTALKDLAKVVELHPQSISPDLQQLDTKIQNLEDVVKIRTGKALEIATLNLCDLKAQRARVADRIKVSMLNEISKLQAALSQDVDYITFMDNFRRIEKSKSAPVVVKSKPAPIVERPGTKPQIARGKRITALKESFEKAIAISDPDAASEYLAQMASMNLLVWKQQEQLDALNERLEKEAQNTALAEEEEKARIQAIAAGEAALAAEAAKPKRARKPRKGSKNDEQ